MTKPRFCLASCSLLGLLLILLIIPACTYDSLEFQPDCTGVVVIELVGVQASSCDQSIGTIEVKLADATAGEASFSIDGSTFQASSRFENLPAGAYTITARLGECENTLDVQVENETGLNATAIATASDCGDNTGTIQVQVDNASGNVSYKLNNGAAQNDANFSGLAPGTYALSVSDDTGCEVTLQATVSSNIEYAAIEAIINSTCAVSGCHAGNVNPDFRDKNNVINAASNIRSRTESQSMPPSSSNLSLSPEEIETIACWVADGAQG